MEHTQNTVQKSTFYESFRAKTPRILACCYFFGGLLIALLAFFGVTSYNGVTLGISNCLDWILDIKNIEEEQSLHYLVRLALAVLYIVYMIRIIKRLVQSIASFRWVMKGQGDAYSRTQAVLSLNVRFGEICGLSMMHILWACLLTSSMSPGQGAYIALVAGLVLIGTGVILNYSYENPATPAFVAVDTFRNLLALAIFVLLMGTMATASFESFYKGVLQAVRFVEMAVEDDENFKLKALLYLLYNQLCLPILRMILWIRGVAVIRQIMGSGRYYAKEEGKENWLTRRFKRLGIFAAVLIGLHCIIGAIGRGIEIQTLLPAALTEFLPIVLLCLTGVLLSQFNYPERYMQKRETVQEQFEAEMNDAVETAMNDESLTEKNEEKEGKKQ